jgi:hypothetical protein
MSCATPPKGLPPSEAADPAAFVTYSGKYSTQTIRYRIDGWSEKLSADQVRTAVRAAFRSWSAVTPLVFLEVRPGQNAEIWMSFKKGDHGDGVVFDGAGKILGHAIPPATGAGGRSISTTTRIGTRRISRALPRMSSDTVWVWITRPTTEP